MKIKSNIKSCYDKTISWLKNTRSARLDNKLLLIGIALKEIIKLISTLEKENAKNKEQISNIKSGIKKELNKCIKEYKETEEQTYIVGLEQRVNNIIDDICTSIKSKEDHLLDIMSGCRKVITELNMAENDFLEVKVLGDKVKKEYQIYADQIEKEFIRNGNLFMETLMKFRKEDDAYLRLSSIEERCTMLELKLK